MATTHSKSFSPQNDVMLSAVGRALKLATLNQDPKKADPKAAAKDKADPRGLWAERILVDAQLSKDLGGPKRVLVAKGAEHVEAPKDLDKASANSTKVTSSLGEALAYIKKGKKNHLSAGKGEKRDREDDSSTEAEMSRAELKCQREKKRRRDMNKSFEELMLNLVKIDPSIKAMQDMSATNLSSAPSSLNRVEVISRTAATLDKLHKENEDQAAQIKELKAKLETTEHERNQALALVAALNTGGSSHIRVNQGPAAALQSMALQSAGPAVPVPSMQLALALSALSGAQGATQNANIQALSAPSVAGNISDLSNHPLLLLLRARR